MRQTLSVADGLTQARDTEFDGDELMRLFAAQF